MNKEIEQKVIQLKRLTKQIRELKKDHRILHDKVRYYFGKAEIKFKAPVVPGDQLRFEVNALKLLSNGGFVDAKAYVQDKIVAVATLGFSVQHLEKKNV